MTRREAIQAALCVALVPVLPKMPRTKRHILFVHACEQPWLARAWHDGGMPAVMWTSPRVVAGLFAKGFHWTAAYIEDAIFHFGPLPQSNPHIAKRLPGWGELVELVVDPYANGLGVRGWAVYEIKPRIAISEPRIRIEIV